VPASADIDNLRLLGHNGVNRAHLMDVEMVGDRAFVSNGLGSGLEVYDISDPTDPTRTYTHGPDAWRAVSSGDTLLFLFCRRDGVALYDISGTGDPVPLGRYDPPGNREALEGGDLRGSTLYAAAHQNGIYIIDVSDPASPRKVGALSLAPTSRAWNVEARDSFLFAANGRHGLAVVGLAGGARRIADLPLPGLANDIALDGDIAAVSLGAAGLATVDISDPYSPVLRDTIGTAGCVWGLGITGHLVIVGSWRVMELFDISDPDHITRAGWDNTYTWAHGADVCEDSVLAVADWRGMSVYRIGQDPGADIDVEPEVLDFGSVSSSRDTAVVVRNTGSGRLSVTAVGTPGGIAADPSSFVVDPGDSQLVTVTATGSGAVSGNIVYNSDDPDESRWSQEVYKNNTGFPQCGSSAPDFTLQGTDSEWHTLSDYRGKVVYLVFGASW